MKTYAELLRDPRWQRKRLEILELDSWQCRRCTSKTQILHVHHLYYIKGAMPWEYDNSALVTYCEECHNNAKAVNWKKAFYDLNLTEFDLLEIAMQVKYKKEKHDALLKDLYEKHKARSHYFYMFFDLFDNQEEVQEFYTNERDKMRESYLHGEKIH